MFFIPLKILCPYERTPYATYALIGLQTLAFLLTLKELPSALILNPGDLELQQLVTSGFLHAGWFHLIGNLIFLGVYGRYVEERLGPLHFLGLYFACEVACNLAYLAFGPDNPSLGASGAISGLMGFVLVGAPFVYVQVLFVFVIFVKRFAVAAIWILGYWFVSQVFAAATTPSWLSGVAYSAHIGGFVAGGAIAAVLKSSICQGTDWFLDPREPEGGPAVAGRLRRMRATRGTAPLVPSTAVVFRSVASDASIVAIIKLMMKRLDFEPDDAKASLDAMRAGEPQTYTLLDRESARQFGEDAMAMGVEVEPVGAFREHLA